MYLNIYICVLINVFNISYYSMTRCWCLCLLPDVLCLRCFSFAFITRWFKFVLYCLWYWIFCCVYLFAGVWCLCSVCLLSGVLCLFLVCWLPYQMFKLCYLFQLLYVLNVCYQMCAVCVMYVNYQNFDICALFVYQLRLMFVLCVFITRCLFDLFLLITRCFCCMCHCNMFDVCFVCIN